MTAVILVRCDKQQWWAGLDNSKQFSLVGVENKSKIGDMYFREELKQRIWGKACPSPAPTRLQRVLSGHKITAMYSLMVLDYSSMSRTGSF